MTDTPYRVMTVCTGNICRSPMAEIVLRNRFAAAGLADRVVVDSTGISAEESGNPIDRRARGTLVARGYDGGTGHVARQVTRDQIGERDLVVAMTTGHSAALRRLAGAGGEHIRLYRSFDPQAPVEAPGGPMRSGHRERELDIADPWYGGPQDFEICLDEVEAAADAIVTYVAARLT